MPNIHVLSGLEDIEMHGVTLLLPCNLIIVYLYLYEMIYILRIKLDLIGLLIIFHG